MSLTATLVNPVVLAGGKTQVRVSGRAIGPRRLHVGRSHMGWIFGSFDRVVLVDVAPEIVVRFGFAKVVLRPTIAPNVRVPDVDEVDVPVPAPALIVPHVKINMAVRLYERGEP